MDTYRCIKTVTVKRYGDAFTEGQLYQGQPFYEESGDDIKAAGVSFRNNKGDLHFAPFDWARQHFEKIVRRPIPELDITSHDELKHRLKSASLSQMAEALKAGQEWLKTFVPETEDDDGLIEAVKERLEMIKEAYQEVGDSPLQLKTPSQESGG